MTGNNGAVALNRGFTYERAGDIWSNVSALMAYSVIPIFDLGWIIIPPAKPF
jgi:hypothetical protein